MPPTTARARADYRVLENLKARESGYDGGDRLLDRPEASQTPNSGTRRRTTSARRAFYVHVTDPPYSPMQYLWESAEQIVQVGARDAIWPDGLFYRVARTPPCWLQAAAAPSAVNLACP